MKNVSVGLVVAIFLAACGGPSSDPGSSESEDGGMESRIFDMPYLMRDLDNGLRVIVVKTDYPDIVTLQIPVQTGSRNEIEEGKTGFAHFFEHMMFRGTEKYPAAEYLDIIKKAGAENNAYTTDDYTNYHINFTKVDLEKILEIEADRFQNLSYSESDFRTEALAVKGEYLKNYSNPLMKAYERTRSLGFKTHPYSHTTMGFIEDIDAMPDQLDYSIQFFDRWYRPEYTTVIVVGDVDPEETFLLVEKYWADWERGSYVADIPQEPSPTGPVYEHMQWQGDTQPWLFVAFRGPAYDATAKDMPAMDLLSSIYFSDSSDLYQKLVLEDQSVDQLNIDFTDSKDPNLLLIFARLTDESHAADVEAAINSTFARARTELLGVEEIERTKTRLRYSFASRMDSSIRIGRILAGFASFERTPETINEVYRSYDGLTADDIRDYANKYFLDASRVTVSLSNAERMSGVDGKFSIDDIVASAERSDAPVKSAASEASTDNLETYAASGDPVAIPIVAQPSAASPLVDVSILFHVGAGSDPVDKKGLASVTAAMLTDGGSASYSIEEINDAMYPIASGFTAQVDKEMTRLSGQVHKDNLDTWYRYARSQLLDPGWREQDFSRIKTQLSNAVRTGLVGNNDEELGKEVLYSEIYGPDHPYGSLNLGHSSDIEGLTLVDVKKFYADNYTINNVTIGLSGGYPESFATQLGNDVQSFQRGRRVALVVPTASVPGGSKAVIVEKETPAVAVSFGFPIELRRGDPDWIALWLARSYLGEHRAASGQLYKRIREVRGMNYGDYSYVEYFPNGMFGFQPATNLARQQQIFQVWIRPVRSNNDAHFATRTAVHEIQKLLEEGMTESDFEATKAFLSKFVSLSMDGQSRQLGYQMDSQYYEMGDFAEYVRDGLSDLTLADVNRVMRENLEMDKVQYVFVTRDADDLKKRLIGNVPSPVTYDNEMPQELLQEDKLIESVSLSLSASDVSVISSDDVFK